MKRLVVTGSGRSGTGYVAELLRRSGVPCGHEQVYTPAAILTDYVEPDWNGFAAESSWLALPFLPKFRFFKQGAIVLVVRHPVAVVQSFLTLGILDRTDEYTRSIEKTTPETMTAPSAPDRAFAHWATWNARASLFADAVVRLEDLDAESFAPWVERLGYNPTPLARAVRDVPRWVNAKNDEKTTVDPELWRRAGFPYRRAAAFFARSFGYDDDRVDAMEKE